MGEIPALAKESDNVPAKLFYDSDDGSFVPVAVFAGVNWEERATAYDQATGQHFYSITLEDQNWQPGDHLPWRCSTRNYRVHVPSGQSHPAGSTESSGTWYDEIRVHCEPLPLESHKGKQTDKVDLYGPDNSAYGYLWALSRAAAETDFLQAIKDRLESRQRRQPLVREGVERYFNGGD